MDLRKVKKLIELVEESGIREIEVKSGDEAVRISMGSYQSVSELANDRAETETSAMAERPRDQSVPIASIKAPMAGTFYRAPSPRSDSFVEVGDTVEVGQVVCIIESMKMMHEIKSTEHGTVVSFEAADGQPINTEDELIRLS